MPVPVEYKAPFYFDSHYHLVFKCHGDLLLFKTNENKHYFLRRFTFFLSQYIDCWAWCLLDNHAHMIIKVRSATDIEPAINLLPEADRTISMKRWITEIDNEKRFNELMERQFGRFMVSYTNSYNKFFKRAGGLFQSPFRRSLIKDEAHLQQAIIYVHANPQRHGLIKDFRFYSFSSYQDIVLGNPSFVNISGVIDFFGGRKKLIELHEDYMPQGRSRVKDDLP